MTTNRSLLAYLSRRLTDRTEDIAVEALGHILSSPAARQALQDVLRSCNTDIGVISRVETQSTGEGGERPDLAGFDEQGQERLLIEAKFWAGLTGNQPVTYLQRLSDEEPSALLVVAPSQRLETLWTELLRRVLEAEDIHHDDGQSDSEIRFAAVGANRILVLTSWQSLTGRIAALASAAGDIQTVNDIQQLQSLSEQEDSETFLPLRPEQLSAEFPRLLPHLYRLIDDTIQRLRTKNLVRTSGFTFTSTRNYSVQYMRFCDVGGAALGIDFGAWRWQDQSPIWLELRAGSIHSSTLEKLRQELSESFQEGSWIYIPIRLKTGVEYDTVLNYVVKQLERIAAILKSESV